MARYSQDFIDRVRAASEISQVVARYGIELKRTGSNLVGSCPFHQEKTPSFNVSTTQPFFNCFGCGAKGDVFKFVQMRENVEFPEAVKILADMAGIPEEEVDPAAAREARRRKSVKERMQQYCSMALDFFQECLQAPAGRPARDYLERRGFDRGTVANWRIGWGGTAWDGLCGFLQKSVKEPEEKGKVLQYAARAGLVKRRDNGEWRDVLQGRVIFPILDSQGRPIGFGGRILKEETYPSGYKPPKYINSPASELFDKSRVLFGMTQAAKDIRISRVAIVVEGYVDAVMCHQYGIRNVVANLGTALTGEQAELLGRATGGSTGDGKVVALFDSDEAGQKATRRAIDVFMEKNVVLEIAGGLESKDAGEYLPQYGADAFREKLARAQESFVWLLNRELEPNRDANPQEFAKAVRRVLATVDKCPDEIARAHMRKALAAVAGVAEDKLPEPVQKIAVQAESRTPRAHAPVAAIQSLARPAKRSGLAPPTGALDMEEALARGKAAKRQREFRLLRYMWENPDWCARVADQYPPDEWRDAVLAELAALVRDSWDMEKSPDVNEIRALAQAREADKWLARLAFPDAEPLSEKDVNQLLGIMQRENRKEEIKLLEAEMGSLEKAGDAAGAALIWKRILELKKRSH